MDKAKFESRYRWDAGVNVSERNISEARANYQKATQRNLTFLRAAKNRAKAMDYFYNLLEDNSARIEEIIKHKEMGGKVIGTFCVQVPEELIYACGAIPVRLDCGFYDSISAGEEIVPKNTCSLIKSSVGFNFLKISPFFEFCDVIIIPTCCDGKKKMIDILSNYKCVWALELPNDKESIMGKQVYAQQVKDLKHKLELLTGKAISKKALRGSILLLQKRTYLARKIVEIRKHNVISLSGRDSYIIMQVAFFDDINRWMKNLEMLVRELIENIKNNKAIALPNAPRLMITGSPMIWPNMKILNIAEELGAVVVIDDSCACTQYFYNPADLNEWTMSAMMDAIADKYLLPIVCPVFVESDDRIDRILELATQHKVDGIIYHILRLCQVFDFEYTKIHHVLKDKGIPLLKIETEYSEEDIGQLKTRIEAFLEILRTRRKK